MAMTRKSRMMESAMIERARVDKTMLAAYRTRLAPSLSRHRHSLHPLRMASTLYHF
jgi:hypothetical protein